ncbi:LysR substrate-binding domain-containing protein [Thalassotalea psychrophila]|uniref:LysR substrate-binding domain-containing protein n=1 Tax=Thalassotalea psychrophila TaxID=3065647 RepID=A0ABY9TNN8_9GAMM|nr:LysR substrate-binding domain-containing protein [Colwelliaceae bacterium SQ149]
MDINLRSVDLNLLLIFDGLMHLQNLSHTATSLGMTQPAVSQALKRLQHMYSDPLFERKGRKMQPTMKATTIHPVITKVLQEIRDTLPVKGAFDPSKLTMQFRINLTYINNGLFIFDFCKALYEQAPGVKLTITSDIVYDAESALRNREYDLCIEHLKLSQSACNNEILYSEKVVVIARKNHPRLGKMKKISLEDYLAEEHAVLIPHKDNIHPLSEMNSEFGERKVGFTGPSMSDTFNIVRITDYIGVIPKTELNYQPLTNELIWFEPPFSTGIANIYMNWHWDMERYQSHRWIRQLLLETCQNNDIISKQ